MSYNRLVNVLVALLLVVGQLAGAVHMASHVPHAPYAPHASHSSHAPALVQGAAGHMLHDHSALEHAAHVHFHVHALAKPASISDTLASIPDKPAGKHHTAHDCTLCHFATHLLALDARASSLPVPASNHSELVELAEHSPARVFTFARTIRGPPSIPLI